MPHFIVHCSKGVLKTHSEDEIIGQVHISAVSTELFHKKDIKVRVDFFEKYTTGDDKEDFIHVFANIMQGRSIEQRANLSRTIVKNLALMFPDVPNIGSNVIEFEKATYFNKNMLNPEYEFSTP
ncbi:MAG: 5-carboxymethyl-2-hydroxymuconate isomerase [Campylobacteraceae bacterium]|nr:5-carboxymethyl-2-hydroxymuconate isomerase [Campylobacteraceae bacterium]